MVDQVQYPDYYGGDYCLPDHIPLISELASSDVVAFINGEHVPFAVVGGFCGSKSVESASGKHTEVAILADFAEHVSELSDEAIEKGRK